MNERVKDIYLKLYENSISCTKDKLSEEFDVTTKTIENTLKPHADDIVYDKQLRRYRFNNLLPKYIPYKIFFNLFKDSINNKFLREDFFTIDNLINKTNELFMIETNKLSDISKRIIMINTAINDNCVIEITYTSIGKETEQKTMEPHKIFSDNFNYYFYATYNHRHYKDVGVTKTFNFNSKGMGDIKPIEYLHNTILKKDIKGNKYGEFSKMDNIILIFDKISGSFYKNSGLFDKPEYEVILGLDSNNVTVKMHYGDLEKEVVKTIQQWMPHIKVHNDDPKKEEVNEIIEKNFKLLLNKM